MYDSKQVKDLKDDQLQQCRANAKSTAGGCIGHFKGEQNERLVKSYEKEIIMRGLDVDISVEGQYNGEGSW